MKHNGYIGTIEKKEGYIYRDKVTAYALVIPVCATVHERYAAEETARIMALAGVNIPIITDSEAAYGKYISLGNTRFASLSKTEMKETEFKRDGFLIETYGNVYVIRGVSGVGIVFGAQAFCEYAFGYVYYCPGEEKIQPEAACLSINIKEIPSFYGRNAFSYLSNTNDDYHFRLRNNYSVKDAREYYGKNHWSSLTDQSYVTQILDYRKYADAHPEWYHFSKEHLEIYPQICYTKGLYDTEQGGFFDTFVKNLIENFIVPESDKTFFMLGISDNEYPCDCERCCEDAEKYGRSGLSIRFVNRVARAVERWRQKNCPEREIYLVSFAYQYDTEPPVKEVNGSFEPLDESVVADDNVIIRYAPIDANYLYPLCDKEHNLKTSKELAGWSKIAKHIAVWDYRQDFHCHAFPFPALLTGEENINIYYEYGVCDIFSQAQRWCDGAPSFVLADNFARARKFWNIHENYTEKFYEFIDAYYKDCAPFICEYIEKLKEFWRKLPERGYKGYVHDGMIRRPYYFRKEEIDEWEVILCRAIKKARDIKDKELSEKLVARVEPLTIFYKLSRLNCFALQQDENEARGLLNELKLLCAKYNFTYFATREPMQMYFDETEKVLSGKTKIEERYIKYRNRGCKY